MVGRRRGQKSSGLSVRVRPSGDRRQAARSPRLVKHAPSRSCAKRKKINQGGGAVPKGGFAVSARCPSFRIPPSAGLFRRLPSLTRSAVALLTLATSAAVKSGMFRFGGRRWRKRCDGVKEIRQARAGLEPVADGRTFVVEAAICRMEVFWCLFSSNKGQPQGL